MDPEARALVRHLFAEITARLEAVAALAAEGQDARSRARQALDLVADLEVALADTGGLVGATRILLSRHAAARSVPVRRRRRKSLEQ